MNRTPPSDCGACPLFATMPSLPAAGTQPKRISRVAQSCFESAATPGIAARRVRNDMPQDALERQQQFIVGDISRKVRSRSVVSHQNDEERTIADEHARLASDRLRSHFALDSGL